MYSMCVICWFTPLTVFFPSVHVSPFDYRTWGGSRTPHLLIHYDLCKPIHSVMVALKLVWEMNSCEGLMAQTHRLAQNYHCEVWCGMHLTCKNIPIIPDRNGSVKRSEKYWKVTIAIARARWNGLEADPSLSFQQSQIVPTLTDCENHATRENWKQVVWKRHGGSWVSHVPLQKIDMKMKQVRRWASSSISQATDECLC